MKPIKQLIQIAEDWVNSDPNTPEGFKKFLVRWYCRQYNTTFKDPTLLSHTIDELAVLYFASEIEKDPEVFKYITDPDYKTKDQLEEESWEEFLKQRMGENYTTEEESIKQVEDYLKKEEEITKTLPDDLSLEL